MPQFKYVRQQIGTGKRWEHTNEFSSEQDFLRHLNDWNRSGHGSWLYYSVDFIPPHLPAAWIRNLDKELPPQHATELDRLVSTGIWSKDGVDRPDELDEIIGEIPSNGC